MVAGKDQRAQPPTRWALENTRVQKALGISAHQYDAYRVSVGQIESGNNPNKGAGGSGNHYWGPYQFGTAATAETSRFLGEPTQKQQFKGNQALAERHFDAYSYMNHQTLMRNSSRYRGMSPAERLGVLGYAHNQGAGGAAKWLSTGVAGRDGFGTSGTKYFDAILSGLKKVGEFIGAVVKGVGEVGKFIWNNTVGAIAPGLKIDPPKQPATNRWIINDPGAPSSHDPNYRPFEPPVRRDVVPQHRPIPDNGWVNRPPHSVPITTVMMGDSIGVGMKDQYPAAQNVAVSGVSIINAIPQFTQVARGSVADVYLGTNNAGYSDQAVKQQTEAFLKQAAASGVHINNWILPAHHAKSPKKDQEFKRVGDIITQTIREYNDAHPQQRPIQVIESRGKGINFEPDGYHITHEGNRKVKSLIAQQTATPRPVYANAEQLPSPTKKWIIAGNQPTKSA